MIQTAMNLTSRDAILLKGDRIVAAGRAETNFSGWSEHKPDRSCSIPRHLLVALHVERFATEWFELGGGYTFLYGPDRIAFEGVEVERLDTRGNLYTFRCNYAARAHVEDWQKLAAEIQRSEVDRWIAAARERA